MVDLVIYHKNCMDGFAAAWAAWKRYGDKPRYWPASHGEDPPPRHMIEGKDIIIADFSYNREILLNIEEIAGSLIVYDHHKTAQRELDGLSFCVFDMERSGAGITWDELHPMQARPALIDYVEDRDLWRFELSSSKEVNAYIGTQPFEFNSYDDMASAHVDALARAGIGALQQINHYVRSMKHEARWKELKGHKVLVVNAPYINTSELVGELAEHPEAVFAVGWFQTASGEFKYSLRSRGDFDVSEIAQCYGGGGHKNAAGFVMPVPFWDLEN